MSKNPVNVSSTLLHY